MNTSKIKKTRNFSVKKTSKNRVKTLKIKEKKCKKEACGSFKAVEEKASKNALKLPQASTLINYPM